MTIHVDTSTHVLTDLFVAVQCHPQQQYSPFQNQVPSRDQVYEYEPPVIMKWIND